VSNGLAVAGLAFVIIALLGIAGWYGIPLLIKGINETLTALPDGLRRLSPLAQDMLASWKSKLESIFPGQGSIDEVLKKKLPELAGPGGDALKLVLATIFGSVVAIGHVLVFLVLTAILTAEWDKNVAKARHLVELYAPRQAPAMIRFGEKFQAYGGELFVGIGIVMLIFMPIFFLMLYLYAGLSLAKSLLWGIILGITSAIPTIGGIITYLLVIVVGLVNLGADQDAITKIGIMYVFSFAVHFVETKFVTPRVLGHRISFTSFAVITVLVGSVLVFGLGKGILTGLFLLVALKAITETLDELRHEPGQPAHGEEPAVASQPAAPAPAAPAALGGAPVASASIVAPAAQPKRIDYRQGRRKGRR